MNTQALLLGIIPLLIFVIVDSFAGLKTALITTIVLALGEAFFSYIIFNELDAVSVFSLIAVILMAIASFRMNNPIYLKFQPVVLSATLGSILCIAYLFGHPLLYEMAVKYQSFYGDQMVQILSNPYLVELLKLYSLSLGFGLFAHAALTAWAALKLSNWWWIAIRGIGFYGFSILAFFITRIIL